MSANDNFIYCKYCRKNFAFGKYLLSRYYNRIKCEYCGYIYPKDSNENHLSKYSVENIPKDSLERITQKSTNFDLSIDKSKKMI